MVWTKEELNWLKKNYPTKGKRHCAEYLGKTEASIRGKAAKLGLKLDRTSPFWQDFQGRAAKSKVGKKRPQHSEYMKNRFSDRTKVPGYKHGMSGTPIYKKWTSMMSRCYKPYTPSYPHYGGRGIRVCDEWHDFENFYAWYVQQPQDASIDRIDVDGDYSPDNCRLASYKTQARNKRNNTLTQEDVDGIREMYRKVKNQRAVARAYNIDYRLVHLVVRRKTWD